MPTAASPEGHSCADGGISHTHLHTCGHLHTCMHAHMHTDAGILTHTPNTCTHTHSCTETGAFSHTHSTCARTHTLMHTDGGTLSHTPNTCTHTHMHAHSCTQTRAFSHTHTRTLICTDSGILMLSTHSCTLTHSFLSTYIYSHTHAHMHTLAYTHMVNHTHTCARMRTDMSILSHTCTHIHAHTHTLSHHHTYYMNISPGPDAALEPSKMSPPHHHPPAPGSWVRCTFPPLSQLPVGLNCVLSKGRKTEPPPGSWVPPPGFFEPCLSAQPQPEGDPGAEPAYQPAAAAQTTERGSRQTALRTCASAKGRTA